MASRLSDLDDFEPEIKVQTEGHTLTLTNAWNGKESPEVFGSVQSCSPSQSLTRKRTPDQPETQYCLEIQVVSTEDNTVVPLPPHIWQAPIIEDMVWEGRTSLTEAIVTGPGWDILFYGQWSLGEGLSLGKARDTTFTLSRISAWVGKQAQFSAKSVSLGDGRQLIVQAIAEGHIKPRGPGHPHSIPPVSTPFNFHNQDMLPQSVNFLVSTKQWEVPWLRQDSRSEALHHSKARTEARDDRSYGWLHPSHLHFHQIMDLRVTWAQCQLHHQCHQCLRGWEDQGIHALADAPTRNQEAIWRSTCQSLRMRTRRMPLHIRVGIGT